MAAFAVTLCATASLLGVSNNLGISAIPTDKLKDRPVKSGLLVAAVTPGSPAASFGLTAGDFILSLNGKAASVAALIAIDKQPADNFSIDAEIWSDGATRAISYSVAEGAVSVSSASSSSGHAKSSVKTEIRVDKKQAIKKESNEEAPTAAKKEPTAKPWLGVHIHNDESGVRIANVVPGSPAAKAGLQPGDLVKSIGSTTVGDVKDVLDAVNSSKKGDSVSVTVNRAGEVKDLHAKLGKTPAEWDRLPPIQDARAWLRQLPKPPALEQLTPESGPDLDAIWEELGRLRGEMERLRRDLNQPHRRR
jgi:S1-C subfamily serine protease